MAQSFQAVRIDFERRRMELADMIHIHLCEASDTMVDMMRECNVSRGDPILEFRDRLECLLEDFEDEYGIGGGE